MKSLPLEGLTVVSLEQAVAAPFATRQLADLGARVIKVERDSGDFARAYDTSVHGQSSYFVWLNRGKESVVLDLKVDADRALVQEIAETADIFVQNLAPGAAERMGLGSAALTARNPCLIYASISGYGALGPLEKKKAYDLLIQCESGLLSTTGFPDGVAKVGVSIADIAAGMYTYTGILTALLNRSKTGAGDVIEISMLEALGEWVQQPELYTRYSGAQPPRTGAAHATIAPYGPFPAADGSVFLSIQNEREWANFCRGVLRDESLLTDARFSNNTARVVHRDELDDSVANVFATLSCDEVLARLDEAAIANARLRTLDEIVDHPQLSARNRWVNVATPGGEVRMQRPPLTSQSQQVIIGAVPAIGEHTNAIRQEFMSP